MTEQEIRRVVQQVFAEERLDHEERMDDVVLKTISAILTGFGIRDDERKDIAEDFRYLRRWRKGSERITATGFTAIITLLVGGLASALYLGVKAMLGRP